MEELLKLFDQTFPLTAEEQQMVRELWCEESELKRGDFLIEPGQIERRIYFVLEGTLRIFYPHEEQEVCVGFGYENTIICAFPSLIKDKPSTYYIQALKGCKFISITKEHFEHLRSVSASIEKCWHMMIEEALLGKIERETEMLTFTPTQRVERLMSRSPHIFQLIPRKHIASYLGMTPETLSRCFAKS